MKIEVANGEIIDKHTILVIKSERISDAGKLADIQREMEALAEGVKFVYNSVDDASTVHDLAEKLKAINARYTRPLNYPSPPKPGTRGSRVRRPENFTPALVRQERFVA
jgi:hypothetical protein